MSRVTPRRLLALCLLSGDGGWCFKGFDFGVWGLGFGFGVRGLGFWVWGLGFRVSGFGFRASGSGFGFRVSDCKVSREIRR